METITDSLERSLQNCSLNNNHDTSRSRSRREQREEGSADIDDDDVVVHNHVLNSDTTLDLSSHLSLPYHWEQCLDLKTGEIYYINWRNGMKAKEDPRSMMIRNNINSYEESDEEEESWYDSEESSSESCCPSSSSNNKENQNNYNNSNNNSNNSNVLVVAGCKSCLMYFMVPKHVEDCPKCTAQLLHFDRSQTNNITSPSP